MDKELLEKEVPREVHANLNQLLIDYFRYDFSEINFYKYAAPKLGEYAYLAELVDFLFNTAFLSNNEILKNYYNTNNTKTSSKKILYSNDTIKLFNTCYDCKLKNRILFDGKIKSSYITKDNTNFVHIDYNEDSEKVSFKALNFHDASKILNKIKFLSFYTSGLTIKNLLSANKIKRTRIIDDILLYMHRISYKKLYETKLTQQELSAFSKRYLFIFKDTVFSEETKEKQLWDLFKSAKEISSSKLINGIFDYANKILEQLNKNSKVFQYQHKNPVSGFVSIKSRRIVFGSELSQEQVNALAEENSNNTKFFESIASELVIKELDLQKKLKADIKLVSGPEIVSLYNVSSYLNTSYHYDRMGNIDEKLTTGGGTLFGSCMRMPISKDKIKFYSENDHIVKLLALVASNGKLLKARAIVWYDEEKDINYVDRIFYSDEKSLLSMISHINKTDKIFSISGVNNYSFLKQSKKIGDFLIKFKGLKYTAEIPYFDTMSDYLYYINGELYFGRTNDYENIQTASSIKENTTYRTNIIFSKSKANINVNSKMQPRSTSCDYCGRSIDSNSKTIKVDGRNLCEKHFTVANDGKLIVRPSNGFFTIEKTIDTYVCGALVHGDIIDGCIYRAKDTARASVGNVTDYRILTMACKTLCYKENNHSFGEHSVISPGHMQKEINGSIESDSNIFKKATNCDSYKTFGSNSSNYVSDYSIYYDPKTIKLVTILGKSVLVPINMDEAEKDRFVSLLKSIFYISKTSNKISTSNMKYILDFNIEVSMCSVSRTKSIEADLSKTNSCEYTNLDSINNVYTFNVNNKLKHFLYTRTSCYNFYLPVECIETKEESMKDLESIILKAMEA
jgi:hypothetical protein